MTDIHIKKSGICLLKFVVFDFLFLKTKILVNNPSTKHS